MQNLHTEFAHTEFALINVSIGSRKKLGQDSLKLSSNSTMNHEIIPKSKDWLWSSNAMPLKKKYVKYVKYVEYVEYVKYVLGRRWRSEKN